MYFRGAPISYGGALMTFIRAPLLHVGAPISISSPLFAYRPPMGLTGAPVGIAYAPLSHVGDPMASEVSLLTFTHAACGCLLFCEEAPL